MFINVNLTAYDSHESVCMNTGHRPTVLSSKISSGRISVQFPISLYPSLSLSAVLLIHKWTKCCFKSVPPDFLDATHPIHHRCGESLYHNWTTGENTVIRLSVVWSGGKMGKGGGRKGGGGKEEQCSLG